MSTRIPKGLLVYATGKTEEIEDPCGRVIYKPCPCCGGQMVFEAVERMAEDYSTVHPGSKADAMRSRAESMGAKLPPMNAGCIVYIQRPA